MVSPDRGRPSCAILAILLSRDDKDKKGGADKLERKDSGRRALRVIVRLGGSGTVKCARAKSVDELERHAS
jgi:hypothetical protein